MLRRQARRERKVARRRSRKRFHARYKFIITRASKHAAGFLARSRHFLLWTLSLFFFSVYPSISTREISSRPPASFASLVSPTYETRHRLSIKKLYNTIPFLLVCFPVWFLSCRPGKKAGAQRRPPFPSQSPDFSLRCSPPPPLSFSLPRYLISN